MTTTDPGLAAVLIDGLDKSGIEYAVLHREAEASAGRVTSDIDLAVGAPVPEVVRILRDAAAGTGADIVMYCPYDTNCVATFWLRPDCASGAQIDLMHDPDGRATYGLRTVAALATARRGDRWMRLSQLTEDLYLLSKRWSKNDGHRVEQILGRNGADRLVGAASSVLSAHGRRRVMAAVAGRRPRPCMGVIHRVRGRVSLRVARRIREPVGFLVRLRGESGAVDGVAEQLRQRLASVLVGCSVENGAVGRIGTARIRLERCRPRVVLCTGSVRMRPDVDIQVDRSAEVDAVAAELWAGLIAAVQRRGEIRPATTVKLRRSA